VRETAILANKKSNQAKSAEIDVAAHCTNFTPFPPRELIDSAVR
jgi:hypothetical protein